MIGMSCTQFSADDPENIMEMVSKDFGLWEIFSEAKNDITKFSSRFNEIKGSYSMRYSIHAPIDNINIAAFNDRIRETSVDEMVRTMEHANRMGIDKVTVHPGTYSFVLYDMKSRSKELAGDSLKRIDKRAAEYGVTAAVENMPSFEMMMGQTPDGLLSLIEDTELAICFDIGHANTVGPIGEFIDVFGDRIVNVHIHDNMGDRDAHLTIGDGNIDFKKVLSRLKGYKGDYIIESRNMESAILSKKRLEGLIRQTK
ncbi:MAG: sugar phosphate isomerase/epimerase [Candidatus Methanoplasma sp.]|jgi:sugar phosphate isomerase/epimerase|nr:sugar phosphate isomerase/epimerase [Candidatus Methanoplasma sp.]